LIIFGLFFDFIDKYPLQSYNIAMGNFKGEQYEQKKQSITQKIKGWL